MPSQGRPVVRRLLLAATLTVASRAPGETVARRDAPDSPLDGRCATPAAAWGSARELLAEGVEQARAGAWAAALCAFGGALQLDPTLWAAHHNLAVALLQSGRVAEAIVHLEKALEHEGGVAAGHRTLGLALLQAGRPAEALLALREALRLDPRHADTRYNEGVALEALERVEEAAAAYRGALALERAHTAARRALERLAGRRRGHPGRPRGA